MNPNPQLRPLLLALLGVALATGPGPRAQEEAPAADKEAEVGLFGSIHVDIQTWVAQPAGLQYTPATLSDPGNPLGTRLLDTDHGTSDEMRYRVAYGLPKNIGELSFAYYSHEDQTETRMFDAGNFVFGELLTPQLFAGFDNHGTADGFIAATKTGLTDWHVDFARPAFQSTHVSGKWSVGWRRVKHDRRQEATYYATLPDLPALLPPLCNNPTPCLDVDPEPDFAVIGSRYTGRGPTVGIDLDFPLWRGKITLEGGASLGVLRGETTTDYASSTYAYLFEYDTGVFAVLNAPYDVLGYYFNNVENIYCPTINYDVNLDTPCDTNDGLIPVASKVSEGRSQVGLNGETVSTSSDVLETYVGIRWKALDWLEVTGGFRSVRYNGVGLDVRPKVTQAGVDSNGIIVTSTDVSETERSATYEGFYAGLKFRLHK